MNAFDSDLFVIAGTDTEIGKTTVTSALLRALVDRGVDARGIKPVESGTRDQPSRNHEDGRRLARAARQDDPAEAFQRLQAPLAPPVAAAREGVTLHPQRWIQRIDALRNDADLLFVEGAGGLLSPLADDLDTRQLALSLQAPVILVAKNALGTLNHTRLTLEAVDHAGLTTTCVIFSAPQHPDASTSSNADVLRALYPNLPVIEFPRVASVDEGAEALATSTLLDLLIP